MNPSGYHAPLFLGDKPRWNDDRFPGGVLDKAAKPHHGEHEHHKEKVLKILNGLCYDIFFRAENIENPEFSKIPDCARLMNVQKPAIQRDKIDFRKPLDSSSKKRTYIIGTALPEPKRIQKHMRRKRRRF